MQLENIFFKDSGKLLLYFQYFFYIWQSYKQELWLPDVQNTAINLFEKINAVHYVYDLN